ncbi:uncharacterized protein JCM15063_006536 [Sporobolomyces koalae]|uniref:uncharacterized protein n=1 Tax=Sporobolomyces koalae TaxID=500713 RepID=UPI0031828A7D
MESLGQLNGALPPPPGEDLQKAFRHAALSITTMYQASKKASAAAYLAGKKEALQDVLEFLQTTLDHPQPNSSSVSRLIDYICARQEALKAEEEDTEEEEAPSPLPRPASATLAPPSPHRPGPFQHRATTPSTSSISATNSAPLSRSNSSYQPRQSTAPVPSTSSAPASPSFSPASFRASSLSRPNPFPVPSLHTSSTHTVSASASPLSSTVNLPLSPIARGSTSHHHSRSLRSRTSSRGKGTTSATGSGQATPIPLGPVGLEAAEIGADAMSLGMKRRWGIPSAAADDVVDVAIEPEARRAGTAEHEGTGEGMEMEMEGWDGMGERPFKRVARGTRRGSSGDTREGDDDGDARGAVSDLPA